MPARDRRDDAAPPPPRPWHAYEVDETLETLGSQLHGLSEREASERLERDGPNVLPEEPPVPAWRRFARQFQNLLIGVLLVAAGTTAAFGDWIETCVILAVVILNALIGYVQEGKAEAALASLRTMLAQGATVVRGGERREIPSSGLVAGDVVLIESGDKVPADLRLITAHQLRCEEAALTGESVPVEKSHRPVPEDAPLGDRASAAFSGTTVAAGAGRGVVIATGARTEVGRIGQLVARVAKVRTPFLEAIDRFSRLLAFVILTAAAVLFAYGLLVRGYPANEAFLMVIGLAVAAIPEGLPAIITITLALGVQRMARRNAILRRLPAIETLGAVTVIATDKTGTLTRNEMTVREVRTADRAWEVSGDGYEPEGRAVLLDRDGRPADGAGDPDAGVALRAVARTAALCSNAGFSTGPDGRRVLSGDPTEGAILTLADKLGARTSDDAERIAELPFESEHGYAAALVREPDGRRWIALKGAPEKVLARCRHETVAVGDVEIDADAWTARLDALTGRAYRALAVGRKEVPHADGEEDPTLDHADVQDGLVLQGVVAMFDPPREEVADAVAACHRAGIGVTMITGDHARTAEAIAQRLGIGDGAPALTGADLDALSDEELNDVVAERSVFARTSPEHKLRLLEALQRRGEVTAMTGDGVNDAPALKRADVGIAMGVKGSEAAKDASEMVLADDDFGTIAAAVAEGRTTYDNLKKTILFMLPTNGAEALVVTAGILVVLADLPITTVQILWANMITAVTLALVLAFEPAEADVMGRPPRDRNEPLLSGYLVARIAYVSTLIGGATLAAFFLALDGGMTLEQARAVAVNVLVAGQGFYLFNTRVLNGSVLTGGRLLANRTALYAVAALIAMQAAFTYAPWFQTWFGTAALPAVAWLPIVAAGAAVFVIVELEKLVTAQIRTRAGARSQRN
ncbi:MAG: HAD-IC family P-type ATPase [Trueperaceae bacterium]